MQHRNAPELCGGIQSRRPQVRGDRSSHSSSTFAQSGAKQRGPGRRSDPDSSRHHDQRTCSQNDVIDSWLLSVAASMVERRHSWRSVTEEPFHRRPGRRSFDPNRAQVRPHPVSAEALVSGIDGSPTCGSRRTIVLVSNIHLESNVPERRVARALGVTFVRRLGALRIRRRRQPGRLLASTVPDGT